MTSFNPQVLDHVVELNGKNLKFALIPIGPWNMLATTNVLVPVPAGINVFNIVSAQAWIIDDAVSFPRPLTDVLSPATPTLQGGITMNNALNFQLIRTTGGEFAAANYSSTAVSRGWLLVTYF